MNCARTVIIIVLVCMRLRNILPTTEQYPTHLFVTASAITNFTHGDVSFYQNFVAGYNHSAKRDKCFTTTYIPVNPRNTAPVWLLLCGDVHPCPGPEAATASDAHVHNGQHRDNMYHMFNSRGLHFIHLNVRSLLPKLDELTQLAGKTRPACIGLSETWLDSSVMDSEISIPGYVLRRRDRNRQGGGVCVYVRHDIAFNPRDDMDNPELEATWIDILLPKSKPILCGIVYRPPKQSNFFQLLETVSSTSIHINNESIILGDFNVNVFNKCTLTESLTAFLNMYNFKQLIQDPTRICNTSSTCIDLILASDRDRISQCGVIDSSISDHSIIYCSR